ncbi:sorting and assembly machinery component 50 homolog [Ostrea edulis]|uniref:sorting and assembly machinery component 50 homolog n=1 Tax=Ostrea edulis TaxID=37623 RepID=UPI002094F818|nr:sorting and assembly machinery component 50 homolog [Ostrea edulis]
MEKREKYSLETVPARVNKIVVKGINKTKDEFLQKKLQTIFKAENVLQMFILCKAAETELKRLDIFKSIQIVIDTSKNVDGDNKYDVLFNVKENRWLYGGAHTTFGGDNNATMVGSLALPNTFGRAENVRLEYNRSLKGDHGGAFRFSKPLNGNPDVRFSTSVYEMNLEYPWSGFKEKSRGINMDFTFPSSLGKHCLRWEGIWRDLRALSRTTSFTVREQAGHSLKSSLKHQFTRDERDAPILPSKGALFKMEQEFAGLGGNVEFFKHDMELQFNQKLVLDTVIQMSLAGGVVKNPNPNEEIRINDRFFLGGPLTLRGFNARGVGPHSDENALGGETYWAGGLHLYTPLPFRPGKGGFGDFFRSHFFINAGNVYNLQSDKSVLENLKGLSDEFRLSYGAGIVLMLGNLARMELNYVVPLRAQARDSVNTGLQFGIGVNFL